MFAASKTAGAVSAAVNYIEEVFSTYLYTGTGSAQTITNGIDLSTKGGLVWQKTRSISDNHYLYDSARGSNYLITNSTNAQVAGSNPNFTTTGFTSAAYGSGVTAVSWTFRKQPKFFDIVTYTGTGVARTISHNLGSTPGCIIVKRTDSTSNWPVYHRGFPSANYSNKLNSTTYITGDSTVWNATAPTSTDFSIGTSTDVNASGGAYVAYLYAHNAGGFGLTGTDNVISCGSFTTNGSGGASITLGYEPQFLIIKNRDDVGAWITTDTMRGWNQFTGYALQPNDVIAEYNYWSTYCQPTATGFNIVNGGLTASIPYIYIAIRKGPMKVPTDATKVFSSIAYTGNGSTQDLTTNFPVDFTINISRNRAWNSNSYALARLTSNYSMNTNATSTEGAGTNLSFTSGNASTSVTLTGSGLNGNGYPFIEWSFRRAPSFFDVVCYTGDGVDGRTVDHNLTVAPELLIVKARSSATNWTGNYWPLGVNRYIYLNSANGASGSNGALRWSSTAPTATQFTLGTIAETNASGITFIAYLFASSPGVSKLGAYTGTGSAITIDCGFPAGAKFVMIKRTDIGSSTGDWYVWDTARGMVSGTDPSLGLNNTTSEANANSVYTVTNGFQILASPTPDINTSGATYFYLAIA